MGQFSIKNPSHIELQVTMCRLYTDILWQIKICWIGWLDAGSSSVDVVGENTWAVRIYLYSSLVHIRMLATWRSCIRSLTTIDASRKHRFHSIWIASTLIADLREIWDMEIWDMTIAEPIGSRLLRCFHGFSVSCYAEQSHRLGTHQGDLNRYGTHAGNIHFQCKVCDNSFAGPAHLSSHMRINHACKEPDVTFHHIVLYGFMPTKLPIVYFPVYVMFHFLAYWLSVSSRCGIYCWI